MLSWFSTETESGYSFVCLFVFLNVCLDIFPVYLSTKTKIFNKKLLKMHLLTPLKLTDGIHICCVSFVLLGIVTS